MKYTFNQFKILFESILEEDKSRLIDKLILPDITDEEEKQKARDEMKAFFKKYNTWENKLDWNKLDEITYLDFKKIKDQATQTKGARKREITSNIKSIFTSIGKRKFEIIDENDNWLFVAPLSYEAAIFCDSSTNQGGSAKWCIGTKNNNSYWKRYIDEGSLFIMAFNKNYKTMNRKELQTNLKYMIQRNQYNDFFIWNQEDESSTNAIKFAKREFLENMFEKLEIIFKKAQDEIKHTLKLKLERKIENLKNITKIDDEFFTEDEKDILEQIEIPDNIKEIGNWAFSDCYKLKRVVISGGVNFIGAYAFAHCHKLKDVIILNGVENISSSAFTACRNITNLIIPDSVKNIDIYAFAGCAELTSIIIGSGVTRIGYKAFQFCSKLKTVIFKGKSSIDEIKAMDEYPWCIKNPLINIKVEK